MVEPVSIFEAFMKKVKEAIERNYSDTSFGVEELALQVGISRWQLHRRLKDISGQSPSQMIREFRLHKAFELLQIQAGTISEIGYQVGFSSPSYFNTCFREHYGYPPGKIPHLRVVKDPGIPVSTRSIGSRANVITGANNLLIIIVIFGAVALILGLLDNLAPFSRFPEWTINLILAILIIGFIIAIVLFWAYKKAEPEERTIPENMPRSSSGWKITRYISSVIIVVLILLVGILAYPRMLGSENLNTMTFPVKVVNEFGERETRRVFKEEFVTKLILFPFENGMKDSSLLWMGWGIMEAVFEDQRQFPNMLVQLDGRSLLNDQIASAQDGKYPHFLTGEYRVDGSMYEITTRLYQTSNAAILNERVFSGTDFFSLVDSICSQVRRDLGISEKILENTPDLPISTLITDHLGAYEHYILGKYWWPLNVSAYSNLNKAIQLDPAFAKAYWVLAFNCFNYQASQISAVESINQAINYRGRLSEFSDIQTRILLYMIRGDRERITMVSEYQIELRPWDFKLLENLHRNYLILGLIDPAKEVAVKLNELLPSHPPYQLMLAYTYLHCGKPDKARKVLNKMLAKDPDHVEAILLLGQAFLHDNKLEAAEEAFNKAIYMMPEHEKHFSYFLSHISFIRDNENIKGVLEQFTNTKRREDGEFAHQGFIKQNQLYHKLKNQAGIFYYPVSDSVVFAVFNNGAQIDFTEWLYIFSKQGKPIRANSVQWSLSNRGLNTTWWIEDSLILRAKDLLAEGLSQQALTAFTKAFEENLEHYYLANYIQHLQLFTSPKYETLQSVFKAYAGSYGDVKFEIRDDHFYYRDHRGVIFELLPLSEDTFMVPSIYNLKIHMVKESSVVSGLRYLYKDGREVFFSRTHNLPL